MFRITLGQPKSIQGMTAYELILAGDSGSSVPPWRYIAVEDNKILGSLGGSSLVTLFDGQEGVWAGSGFFDTRFDANELSKARKGTITEREEIASWPGVRVGPAIVVGRANSQSECEIIEGRRICPRQESHSFAEREWYRAGIGAVGYHFRSSSSYSGGDFFSSHSSEEHVALVASSLRGDVARELAPEASDLTEFVEEFLAEAVRAEIASYSNSDHSYISKFMTGEPLRSIKYNLGSLSEKGMVYVPRFDFANSSTVAIRTVRNGKIEVDRCEIWSGSYHPRDENAPVTEEPPDLVPQTITIEHLRAGWFITRIAFYDAPSFC